MAKLCLYYSDECFYFTIPSVSRIELDTRNNNFTIRFRNGNDDISVIDGIVQYEGDYVSMPEILTKGYKGFKGLFGKGVFDGLSKEDEKILVSEEFPQRSRCKKS